MHSILVEMNISSKSLMLILPKQHENLPKNFQSSPPCSLNISYDTTSLNHRRALDLCIN